MRCVSCKKPLSDPVSISRGMGPVCWASTQGKLDKNPTEENRIIGAFTGDVVLVRSGKGIIGTNIPQKVIHHSPTGFEWGYGGSGPADLSLNILELLIPAGSDGEEPVKCFRGECSATAWRLHQDFKRRFIAAVPREGMTIEGVDIVEWLVKRGVSPTRCPEVNGHPKGWQLRMPHAADTIMEGI